jgi:hypothetical protein
LEKLKEVPPVPKGLTSSAWASSQKKPSAVSSKDSPRTLLDLWDNMRYVRAAEDGTSGSNNSKYYPLRILKQEALADKAEGDYPTFANSTNSVGCLHYYIDATIDVLASRSKSCRFGGRMILRALGSSSQRV